KFANAARDGNPVLVELVFPQHAGQHRTTQLQLRRDLLCRRAFVRSRSLQPGNVQIQSVEAGHDFLSKQPWAANSPGFGDDKNFRPGSLSQPSDPWSGLPVPKPRVALETPPLFRQFVKLPKIRVLQIPRSP